MPNQYRPGTITITLRIPSELRARIRVLAAARKTSVNRFIRDRLEEQAATEALAMRQRVLNPLRGSPRRRPRVSLPAMSALTVSQGQCREQRAIGGNDMWKVTGSAKGERRMALSLC